MQRRTSSTNLVRRLFGAFLAAFVLGAGLVIGTATSATAASEEYSFLAKINSSRQSHGLKPLTMSGDLQSIARDWSRHMGAGKCAGDAPICHNPNLTSQASNWRKIGENVGVGGDVSSIQNAFMNSSHHRANILDPSYTQVGIGTVYGKDGRLYVTQDFRQPMNAPSGSGSSTKKKSSAKKKSPTKPAASKPSSSAPTSAAPAPRTASPYQVPSAPVQPKADNPAPKPTPSLAAKLRKAAKAHTDAADPVRQALSFVSTMDVLAR